MMLFDLLKKKPAFEIQGKNGVISARLTLPEGFDCNAGKCKMAILMHGFMARKDMFPIIALEKALPAMGVATLSFDFNGHGKSGGSFSDMTVLNELEDAQTVWDYACALPYVTDIALIGHSQGGVVAGLLAGALENAEDGRKPAFIVQLAPAAVLHDDAWNGSIMGAKFDPKNPPEILKVFFHKLGRCYILCAQELDIFGRSCVYTGKVCLIHGDKDTVVPHSYSIEYDKRYADSELHIIPGENHFLKKKKETLAIAVEFVKRQFC